MSTENNNSLLKCKEVNAKPFMYAMSLIDGKWKMHILFWLWKNEVLRYGELKRALGDVTHKMLSKQFHQKLSIDYLKEVNHLCLCCKHFVTGGMSISMIKNILKKNIIEN